ncbi:Yar1p Ecym_2150 [Eremothecium cymbalariae DBVPG|uniref:Uncharacterized protein n=1 Tax=Eremothecium cymbalariae (strain CBS 270.75 / DBVPG 7215 / KCTC 17166 / NRRL Y-17582) TaxID=931890 RepID=G8JNI6_ERECY|nr:Hypothetical protein Ecym_2150 [Eremothecium cymbalariae DBVPG\
MGLHELPLDPEDQESVVLDARAGDLEGLKEIFTQVIHPKLLVSCRDPTTKSTPLHMAAANGHLDVVKYLLSLVQPSYQAEWVNMQNETGNTALHWASLNGNLDIVKLLCEEYKANPFIRNNFDHDAIFEAEKSGKEEVETYYLQKYDVEPEQDENQEMTSSAKTGSINPSNVEITEGTEIEQANKEATEALTEETSNMKLSE